MVFEVLRIVLLCFRMVFMKLVWRSSSLVVVVVLSGLGSHCMGHVRRPPIGGFASVHVMSGRMSPSTTPQATGIRRGIVSDAFVGFDFSYVGDKA